MSSVLQSCCDSSYIFSKKRTPSEEKCNNHAKIIITACTIQKSNSRDAFRTQSQIYDGEFLQK